MTDSNDTLTTYELIQPSDDYYFDADGQVTWHDPEEY